jgi:serine/threonine-protein kinase HipA
VKARALTVLLGAQRAGSVEPGRNGRPTFTYDDGYRSDPNAVALSLSLPLAAREHKSREVEAFLWGLLPDNDRVLEGWGRRFHVSPRSVVGLLAEVGEDCPGAVQLVRPERVDRYQGAGRDPIQWIDASEIAARLRSMRHDPSAWRSEEDSGQFSLAGAQPKTALLVRDRRWGVPSGREPTTHILKPPLMDLEGHAENEHACLALARELGLPAARSEIRWFEDEVAIVVERFDRAPAARGRIVRVHQEDCCQALAVHPLRKYENDGGPGAAAIASLLRDHSTQPTQDIDTFVGALILSWLIGATDAHAKNYALLHAPQSRVRLAPLYDVASILPYDRFDPRKVKLAMNIGGTYRLRDIAVAQWRKLASRVGLSERDMVDRVRTMARDVGPAFDRVHERLRADGLSHDVLGRLSAAIAARANQCSRV